MSKIVTLITGLFSVFHLHNGTIDLKLPQQPNIIIIISDDLNDRVGFLQEKVQAKTPNLDRLAKHSMNFTDAHAPATLCNPSRTSILTSRLPSNTGVYRIAPLNQPHGLIEAGELTTMMQVFKEAGYLSLGTGKIFHRGDNNPKYFDEYYDTSVRYNFQTNRLVIGYKYWEGDEKSFSDVQKTDWAIEHLNKQHDKPFLMIVGYEAPHLPWVVPKRYFDLYDPESIEVPQVDDNAKIVQRDDYIEPFIRNKDYAKWKEVIRGYFAAVSFMDDQVGRLTDALEASHYAKNTIVIFIGDHGFHLGEKKATQKVTLWKESTHVPFLMKIPGITDLGQNCDKVVSLLDIFPTLVDLCKIQSNTQFDGISLKPLLENQNCRWNRSVLTTQFYMNHSVRTDQWCYIKYADGREELYDRVADPYENNDLSDHKKFAKIKQKMQNLLPSTNREEVTQ